MEINAPEMITSNINYISTSIDPWDGDYDIHYIERYTTFEVPRWDEYAPMIYRCPYRGTKPYGDTPKWINTNIATTFDFYSELKIHADGVMRVHNDSKRIGVYIGITNCTCYGRDVEINEYGQNLGNGYDVLVRDTLICKSFGLQRVTIFILTTEIENGFSMGGVFDSYGDDFLDRFNESVNGPNANTPFKIPRHGISYKSNLIPSTMFLYLKDALYNLNQPGYFIVLLLAITVPVVLIIKPKIAKINQIKEKILK
jgi:hypothetical protein